MHFVKGNPAILFLWLLLLITIGGCVREEFSIDKVDSSLDIESAVAIPLGYFDFGLEEYLRIKGNSRITINHDRIVSLTYYREITSDPAGELFKFDLISNRFSIPNSTGESIDLSSGLFEINYSSKVPVFLSNAGIGADIDSVILSRGFVNLSDIQFPEALGEMLIVIPGLKRNGESFQIEVSRDEGNILTDLSGYTLELTREDPLNNLIDIDISVSFPQQSKTISPSEPLINFHFEINIQDWDRIYGFLGRESIDFGQQSFLTEFDRLFPEGEFHFIGPKLSVETINTYSIPMALGLSDFIAESGESDTWSISGPGVPLAPNYFLPAYPAPGNLLMEARDSFVIDSENSNINDAVTSTSDLIRYQVELITNPGDEKIQNVVHNKSSFSTQIELELPFHGSANSLRMKDSIRIDLSRLYFPKDEIIQNAIFKLYYENTFPVEIDLQLYFANEFFIVTDTLFETFAKINAAIPEDNANDKPSAVSGLVTVTVPGYKLDGFTNASQIIGEAYINTNIAYEDVKIFDTQRLSLRLGVIFDINAKIEDF